MNSQLCLMTRDRSDTRHLDKYPKVQGRFFTTLPGNKKAARHCINELIKCLYLYKKNCVLKFVLKMQWC